jgi:predicted Zn-dependent protease
MLKKICTLVATAFALTACITSPTGRKQLILLPDSQVDQMGLQAFETLKRDKPISTNARLNQVANCIASNITQGIGGRWEVVVFEDDSFNAFALPGNKIGVYTGLFKLIDNQDQLAAVIGHEIGHVLAKHSAERASQELAVNSGMSIVQAMANPQSTMGRAAFGMLELGAEYGVLMPYGRTQESESDIIGVDLIAKAGFDPRQSISLWQRMSQAMQGQQTAEFMSTHPSHATRIRDLERHMPQAMGFFQQAQGMGRRPQCQ